jgi:hypothetical protein
VNQAESEVMPTGEPTTRISSWLSAWFPFELTADGGRAWVPASAAARLASNQVGLNTHADMVHVRGGRGRSSRLGPVERGYPPESRQLQNQGRPFDYNLVGHFHQYAPRYPQGFVMNGSLNGYDDYARTLYFNPEHVQHSLMVVTPEQGITVCVPAIVAKRSAEVGRWRSAPASANRERR